MSMYSKHPRFSPPPAKSVVKPLPRARRRFLFLGLIAIFICSVPAFVFYATGYRYDFFADVPTITATGGLYIAVGHEDGEVYLDDTLVEDQRSFRSASYIQNISAGLKRIHVQVPGYQVWVKELPVYAHIVTEGSAFLFPDRPQLRPITAYTTSTGTPVYLGVATSTRIVPFASTTVAFRATTSKATTTLSRNPEYDFVKSLFATTTATTTTPLIARVVDEARDIFTSDDQVATSATTTTATSTLPTETATTTLVVNDTQLYTRDGDVYVRFTGPEQSVPYYFCIPEDIGSSSARYDAQYKEARSSLLRELASTSETTIETTTSVDRLCRREIKIDKAWQNVISFTFYPGSTDLIIMHRGDGVYVTEVDDRAWQNSQQIYPGSATAVKVDGGRIFVQDGEYFFEILPTLISEE
jgi:hypothetical protein